MSLEIFEIVLSLEDSQIFWRNDELARTDIAAYVPDYPNRDNILLYRTALRNWPAATDEEGEALFPSTRPTLGD